MLGIVTAHAPWTAHKPHVTGGHGDVMHIDDNGRPFRTTSKATAPEPDRREYNKLPAG